jgi:hypothetical protein
MVARMWKGWVGARDADEVAAHLRDVALARYEADPACVSTTVLTRPLAGGVELVSLTVWTSEASVPDGVAEEHPLLVARQTVADVWEVSETPRAVARAA